MVDVLFQNPCNRNFPLKFKRHSNGLKKLQHKVILLAAIIHIAPAAHQWADAVVHAGFVDFCCNILPGKAAMIYVHLTKRITANVHASICPPQKNNPPNTKFILSSNVFRMGMVDVFHSATWTYGPKSGGELCKNHVPSCQHSGVIVWGRLVPEKTMKNQHAAFGTPSLADTNWGLNPPKSSTSRVFSSRRKRFAAGFTANTCKEFQHQDQGWNFGGEKGTFISHRSLDVSKKSDRCLGFFHRDKGPLHLLSKRSKNHYWACEATYNMDLIELKLLIRPLLH